MHENKLVRWFQNLFLPKLPSRREIIKDEIKKTHRLIVQGGLHIANYQRMIAKIDNDGGESQKKERAQKDMKLLQLQEANEFNEGFLEMLYAELEKGDEVVVEISEE